MSLHIDWVLVDHLNIFMYAQWIIIHHLRKVTKYSRDCAAWHNWPIWREVEIYDSSVLLLSIPTIDICYNPVEPHFSTLLYQNPRSIGTITWSDKHVDVSIPFMYWLDGIIGGLSVWTNVGRVCIVQIWFVLWHNSNIKIHIHFLIIKPKTFNHIFANTNSPNIGPDW